MILPSIIDAVFHDNIPRTADQESATFLMRGFWGHSLFGGRLHPVYTYHSRRHHVIAAGPNRGAGGGPACDVDHTVRKGDHKPPRVLVIRHRHQYAG